MQVSNNFQGIYDDSFGNSSEYGKSMSPIRGFKLSRYFLFHLVITYCPFFLSVLQPDMVLSLSNLLHQYIASLIEQTHQGK